MHLTSAKSVTRPIMNAHEFINYKLGCDLNNSYIHIEDEINVR